MNENNSWGLYEGWAKSPQDLLSRSNTRITPDLIEGFFRQYWRGEYNISAAYAPMSGFNVASTPALDINVGDVTITYVNYLKMMSLLDGGLGDNTNIDGILSGVYYSMIAAGFSIGVKNLMIEGGAASYRGTAISKVNNISIIRTYGVAGAKYLQYARGLGTFGSVVTTGYSGYQVYNQFKEGGISEVFQNRDILDFGVGVLGIYSALMLSNPIGWGIGFGVLIYSGTILVVDALNE